MRCSTISFVCSQFIYINFLAPICCLESSWKQKRIILLYITCSFVQFDFIYLIFIHLSKCLSICLDARPSLIPIPKTPSCVFIMHNLVCLRGGEANISFSLSKLKKTLTYTAFTLLQMKNPTTIYSSVKLQISRPNH